MRPRAFVQFRGIPKTLKVWDARATLSGDLQVQTGAEKASQTGLMISKLLALFVHSELRWCSQLGSAKCFQVSDAER